MSNESFKRNLEAGLDLARDIQAQGYRAFLVGGAVRDLLREGAQGGADADLVTDMPVDQIKRRYRAISVGKGEKSGALLVHGREEFADVMLDVVQFRTEIGSDGRRPEIVTFGASLEEDALRRDFTIGALYLDIHGQVLDPTGRGLRDLRERRLASTDAPAKMLSEDPVRLLRALRFSATLDFRLDDALRQAIVELAPLIAREPGQRLWNEMQKAAKGGGTALAAFLEAMRATGVLVHAFPWLDALAGLPHNPHQHPEGDVWEHTLAALRSCRERNLMTLLAITVHDIGKSASYKLHPRRGHTYDGHAEVGAQMLIQVHKRLRTNNEQHAALQFAVRHHMMLHEAEACRPTVAYRLFSDPNWPLLLAVFEADDAARGDMADPQELRRVVGILTDKAAIAAQRLAAQSSRATPICGHHVKKVAEEAGMPLRGAQIGAVIERVSAALLDEGAGRDQLDTLIQEAAAFAAVHVAPFPQKNA